MESPLHAAGTPGKRDSSGSIFNSTTYEAILRGRYTFNGSFSSNPLDPSDTGDPFADFLLGVAQSTRRQTGLPQAYLRQQNYGFYLQDEWRATRNLTVNVGVRYELTSPYIYEKRANLFNLDYSSLPGAPLLVRVKKPIGQIETTLLHG